MKTIIKAGMTLAVLGIMTIPSLLGNTAQAYWPGYGPRYYAAPPVRACRPFVAPRSRFFREPLVERRFEQRRFFDNRFAYRHPGWRY